MDKLELKSVRPREEKEDAGKEMGLARFKMQKSRLEELGSSIVAGC